MKATRQLKEEHGGAKVMLEEHEQGRHEEFRALLEALSAMHLW